MVTPARDASNEPKSWHGRKLAGVQTGRRVGDLDFSAYFLSRASFNPSLTPKQALEEFTTAALGEGTYERTQKAFDLVEQATTLIDQNDIGFSFPVPNIIMKHYLSKLLPAYILIRNF